MVKCIAITDLEYKDIEYIDNVLKPVFSWNTDGELYVGLVNGEYHYLFNVVKVFGFSIIHTYDVCGNLTSKKDNLVKIVIELSKKIDNSIFRFDSLRGLELPEYFREIDRRNTEFGCIGNDIVLRDGWYMTQYSTKMLLDEIESHLFVREIDEDVIVFKDIDSTDIENMQRLFESRTSNLCSMEWEHINGSRSIYGFKWLRKLDSCFSNHRWLAAVQQGRILGVIAYSEHCYDFHNHYTIQYVDIAAPYRGKGIDKMLTKEIKLHLKNNIPVYVGLDILKDRELNDLIVWFSEWDRELKGVK